MTQAVATEIKMLSKIVPKSLGNPKKAAALDEVGQAVVLGQLFGICDGIKQKEDPITGKIYFPLTGRFQGNCADGSVIRSGILYLPSGIHETYESAARQLDEGATLQFAIEIQTVKDSNAAGYHYEAKDLVPRTEADPLDKFAETVLQKKLAAPAPAAGKAVTKK